MESVQKESMETRNPRIIVNKKHGSLGKAKKKTINLIDQGIMFEHELLKEVYMRHGEGEYMLQLVQKGQKGWRTVWKGSLRVLENDLLHHSSWLNKINEHTDLQYSPTKSPGNTLQI